MSFHQRETTRHGGTVPWPLTEPAAARLHRRMKGTPGRCVALTGTIGAATCCTIYEARPEVCRELQPGTEACNAARALYGLEPIS